MAATFTDDLSTPGSTAAASTSCSSSHYASATKIVSGLRSEHCDGEGRERSWTGRYGSARAPAHSKDAPVPTFSASLDLRPEPFPTNACVRSSTC